MTPITPPDTVALLTMAETAERTGRSLHTLRRWDRMPEGKSPLKAATRVGPYNERYYREHEVTELVQALALLRGAR